MNTSALITIVGNTKDNDVYIRIPARYFNEHGVNYEELYKKGFTSLLSINSNHYFLIIDKTIQEPKITIPVLNPESECDISTIASNSKLEFIYNFTLLGWVAHYYFLIKKQWKVFINKQKSLMHSFL